MAAKKTHQTVSQEISEKELKWVKMLSNGIPANDIAKKEGINKNTFAFNLKELRLRFNCNNSLHLTAFFIRNGLID